MKRSPLLLLLLLLVEGLAAGWLAGRAAAVGLPGAWGGRPGAAVAGGVRHGGQHEGGRQLEGPTFCGKLGGREGQTGGRS